MRVQIKKIVYPGKSLAESGGKIVFTDEGLPGEDVEVAVVREKKDFTEAETRDVVLKSPHRVEPRCAHYRSCSPYQVMDYGFQLETKKAQVREIFGREIRLDPETMEGFECVPSPQIWGYRNKAEFRILWKNGRAFLAYHEPKSQHDLIPVPRCYLVPDDMHPVFAKALRLANIERLYGIRSIEVKKSSASGRFLVILQAASPSDLEAVGRGFSRWTGDRRISGIVGVIKRGKSFKSALLWGEDFIDETVRGKIFRIGPRSFFQVNIGMLPRVVRDMENAIASLGIKNARIADLYCGIGTFGILLSQEGRKVIGVESEGENIAYLKKNLGLNRIEDYSILEGTSERWISRILKEEVDVLILDPPRKGVDPPVIQALRDNPVPLVLYLSCNPSTLARDLKNLLKSYELKGLKIYDFFPHTPHIETLAILERRKPVIISK